MLQGNLHDQLVLDLLGEKLNYCFDITLDLPRDGAVGEHTVLIREILDHQSTTSSQPDIYYSSLWTLLTCDVNSVTSTTF